MASIQDQIAELSRHLYEQHKAAQSEPVIDKGILRIETNEGVEEFVVSRSTKPIAPQAIPMMGSRYIPGKVEVTATINIIEEEKTKKQIEYRRMLEV